MCIYFEKNIILFFLCLNTLHYNIKFFKLIAFVFFPKKLFGYQITYVFFTRLNILIEF